MDEQTKSILLFVTLVGIGYYYYSKSQNPINKLFSGHNPGSTSLTRMILEDPLSYNSSYVNIQR